MPWQFMSHNLFISLHIKINVSFEYRAVVGFDTL